MLKFIMFFNNLSFNFIKILFIFNNPLISMMMITLMKIICILLTVAYFTMAERKMMASIQSRLGPNVEGGSTGILQPLADGLKLFIKELMIPGRANIFMYFMAPVLIFTLSLLGWSIMPFFPIWTFFSSFENNPFTIFYIPKFADTNYSVLFLLAMSSLNVYGIILGGWASNSKYAFLGSLSSAAQMMSYEVSLGLTMLPVILLTGSFNFIDIIKIQSEICWFFFPLLPCAIIFFISMLAETNRAPFDLPEAEAELVAGYNVEYSSMAFALFFLGEYSSMLLMASFLVILFYGGWDFPLFKMEQYYTVIYASFFAMKMIFFSFLYILVRATSPSYRYDQLMSIGWKSLLPFTLGFFFLVTGILLFFNCIPNFILILKM